jgi:hypothetical protein
MSLENIKITYRSLRIGFCVRNGNIQDIITASKLNTLLWGGIYNPIIPVGAPDDLADKLVNFFQVDVLVPIVDTDEIKDFIKKHEWARFPLFYHSNQIITDDSFKIGHKKVSVLDVSHIFKKLWENEFKFSSKNKSNCAFVSWKPTDSDANVFNLIFGTYPEEKFSFKYPIHYKNALRARDVKIPKDKPIQTFLGSAINPILLTEHEIKRYGNTHVIAGVYIGDSDNFDDLISFWNIRACGSYITFLPKKSIKRFLPYIKAYISKIKKSPEFKNLPVVKIRFNGKTQADYKEIQKIIKPLEDKSRILEVGSVSHMWDQANIASYNVISEVSCPCNIETKYDRPQVTIQLLDKPFVKDEKVFFDQYFAVSFKSLIGVEEYTTGLPVLPDLNEWYARQMISDPYSIRVIKNYFGHCVSIITDVNKDIIGFNPISKIEIIKKVFERASITAKKSGAGLFAERLVALMGGIMGSARIFKITGVRKFIEDTNPLHQKTKHEIENIINDNGSFKKFENEFGLKGHTPMTLNEVFETMIEKNLLQTGVEVRCPKCSIKNWINLKDINENYSCEFCYEKSKFVETVEPIEIKSDEEIKKIDGIRWYYRLGGLLSKGDKQQGALPVILTLLYLGNKLHSGFSGESIQSTALELTYKKGSVEEKAETDLIIMDLSDSMAKEDIEILIGECKTGQQITKQQIDRLITVRELLQKSGIKCHLIFAKTKGSFSTSEIGQFKKLYNNGIKPLLFTSHELEKWWNDYKDFEVGRPDFKLPYKYPFTFDEIAENSAYIYKLY